MSLLSPTRERSNPLGEFKLRGNRVVAALIVGPMPPQQVNGFLASSELMLRTAASNELHHRLIRAWQQGRTIVSLQFNPGGIIARNGLGAVCGTVDEMSIQLRRLLADEALRAATRERARQHAAAAHDPAINLSRLDDFLRGVVKAHRAVLE